MFTIALVIWLNTAAATQAAVPLWDHFLERADLPPGRVLLILFDADGDGRNEIFLAPAGTCGNGGCAWFVYSRAAAPNQVRYLGEAGFSPGGYRYSRDTHTMTDCWHMSAADCMLGEHRFERGQMIHRNLGRCDSTEARCENELARIRRWQAEEAPPSYSADVPATGDLAALRWRNLKEAAGAKPGALPNFDRLVVITPPK
jgi:hypothetical protein